MLCSIGSENPNSRALLTAGKSAKALPARRMVPGWGIRSSTVQPSSGGPPIKRYVLPTIRATNGHMDTAFKQLTQLYLLTATGVGDTERVNEARAWLTALGELK